MVTENMFGDILSDLGAGLMGGLGLAPSADIGQEHAVFQPCHGIGPRHCRARHRQPAGDDPVGGDDAGLAGAAPRSARHGADAARSARSCRCASRGASMILTADLGGGPRRKRRQRLWR